MIGYCKVRPSDFRARQSMMAVVPCFGLDLLVEILKRLPIKSILRLRCVCKSWLSLTREPHFINEHIKWWHSNPPVLSVIALSWIHQRIIFSSNGWHRLDMIGPNKVESLNISNSCKGLICVYSSNIMYVMNPSIREVLVLPKIEGFTVALALVHVESTGEYKIVRLFKRVWAYEFIECGILTLGSSSWRSIKVAPSQIRYYSLPVFINGAVHWPTMYKGRGIMVSFDVKNEVFEVIMPPKSLPESIHTEVREFEGNLCVSDISVPWLAQRRWRRNMWILTNYKERTWTRRSFFLDLIDEKYPDDLAMYKKAEQIRKGKVMEVGVDGRFDHLYDPKIGTLMYFTWGKVVNYEESLVSPIEIHENGIRGILRDSAAVKWGSREEWGQWFPSSTFMHGSGEWYLRICKFR